MIELTGDGLGGGSGGSDGGVCGSFGDGSGGGVLINNWVWTMPTQLWTSLTNYSVCIHSFEKWHLPTIACLASIFFIIS